MTRPPQTEAVKEYMPKVGTRSTMASPGLSSARAIRSINSSLPAPATMCSAGTPV
jgi:hypothetical protein